MIKTILHGFFFSAKIWCIRDSMRFRLNRGCLHFLIFKSNAVTIECFMLTTIIYCFLINKLYEIIGAAFKHKI